MPEQANDDLRKIVQRYEYEEDEFLRELDEMQDQLSQRSSLCDEAPVLGALCSLVGEIGELRRENRDLRIRLTVPSQPRSRITNRFGAILDTRANIFPKFVGKKNFYREIRSGARDRLLTPPKRENLTSSFSTDLSSDYSDQKLTVNNLSSAVIKTPPIVFPEMSDSEIEQNVFSEVALPEYEKGWSSYNKGTRFTMRLSSGSTSEYNSYSPVSLRDNPDSMTCSRSSFLQFIGIKKKEKKEISEKEIIKKRKRKISESDSVNSNENARCFDKAKRNSMIIKRDTPTVQNIERRSKSGKDPLGSITRPLYHRKKSETDAVRELKTSNQESKFRSKNFGWNWNRSDNTKSDSNMLGEFEELKKCNTQLSYDLRAKSIECSKLKSQIDVLCKQVKMLTNHCEFNDAMKRSTFNDQIMNGPLLLFNETEKKLKSFEENLQKIRAENLKNQQAAVTLSHREQNAYQICLEQLERLQRDNFSLIHARTTELLNDSCSSSHAELRQFLEILPSYDALYSFALNAVKKLGRLRSLFLEKVVFAGNLDLEMLNAQSSLLITHAQIGRLKMQLQAIHEEKPRRSSSFHGEDFIQRLVKPHLNFLLPFKLHGSRLGKLRRSESMNMELNMERNEEAIELEFLRLFDYARYFSKPTEIRNLENCRDFGSRKQFMRRTEEKGTNSTECAIKKRDSLTRNKAQFMQKNGGKKECTRPISLVEVREQQLIGTGNIRKFAENIEKKGENPNKPNSPSSILNLHRLTHSGNVKAIVSSLQDVSNRSIPSTPVTPRKFPVYPTDEQNISGRLQQPQRLHYSYVRNAFGENDALSEEKLSSGIKQNFTYTNQEVSAKQLVTLKGSPLLSTPGMKPYGTTYSASIQTSDNSNTRNVALSQPMSSKNPFSISKLSGNEEKGVQSQNMKTKQTVQYADNNAYDHSNDVIEKSRLPRLSGGVKRKGGWWLQRLKSSKKVI